MAYSKAFFEGQQRGSLESARRVVPLIVELVRPRSVVDVGCGVGGWLAVFQELGVEDVRGYDGGYVPREALAVAPERFVAADLTRPVRAERGFDLAMSLEVGEHLPESAADTLVESLTGLAPVVVFSAAVPMQGGTGHVNEQWPTYWAGLFATRGWVVVDALRPRVWEDERVAWWYRQNMLVFVREDALARYPALASARDRTSETMISVVHPRLLAKRNEKPLRPLAKAAVLAAWVRWGKQRATGG